MLDKISYTKHSGCIHMLINVLNNVKISIVWGVGKQAIIVVKLVMLRPYILKAMSIMLEVNEVLDK